MWMIDETCKPLEPHSTGSKYEMLSDDILLFLGLRSALGAGFARMNDLTVIQTSQVTRNIFSQVILTINLFSFKIISERHEIEYTPSGTARTTRNDN